MSTLQYVDLDQRTPAWLAWRRARRMASETPVLLGLSKYGVRTPADLWRAKVLDEREPAGDYVERARAHGEEHEPAALAAVNKLLGLDMAPACFERGDWAASFDGIDWDLGADFAREIAEIKCPYAGIKSTRWQLAERGQVRDDDMAQIQHQLLVSAASRAHYAVYVPGAGLKILTVLPMRSWRDRIAEVWDAFWPHIESGTPPESEVAERDDSDWASAVAAYAAAKAADARAAADLKAAEKRLHALAGERSTRGAGLALTRYFARGNVDYTQIPALAGVELDLYRKPGAWRTRINLEKTK